MLHLSVSTGPWRLLTSWTLATLIGWVVGLVLGVALSLALSRVGGLNEDRVLLYAGLLGLGVAIGLAQWPVIWAYLPAAWRWALATVAGYLLATLLVVAVSGAQIVGWEPVLFAVMGAAVGLPQAWLLRRHYQGAEAWVLASALSFMSLLWLVAHPVGSASELIVVGGTLGALGALATGVTLAWLVQRPRRAGGARVP